MVKKPIHTMETLVGPDWCHACGNRVESLVGIHTFQNAEHALLNPRMKQPLKYIRICSECIEDMYRMWL